MRCPKCGVDLNPHSERCPRCGTSAKLAKPDGDTMTRVRRQIAVVRRQTPPPEEDYSDASFSPVMRFEKELPPKQAKEIIEENPADNFQAEIFKPVDIEELLQKQEESEADVRHRAISAEIRSMVKNKEDDLLAEYYFKDGISDLERYQYAKRMADLKNAASQAESDQSETEAETPVPAEDTPAEPPEEEMSEAARRLNTFPEESGLDKVLTFIGEKYDSAVLAVKGFWQRTVHVRFKRIYDQFDQKTAPFLNKLLDRFYHMRFGKLKRRIPESEEEKSKARQKIWSVCGVLLAVVLCVGIFVASLFTDEITGQWVVSYDINDKPNVIMEFTPGGSAIVSVKSEDGWHVHKQGQYKTRRKNGHDMLTITYEDGTVSRLYYEIQGRSGTFINVETNVEVVYDLK